MQPLSANLTKGQFSHSTPLNMLRCKLKQVSIGFWFHVRHEQRQASILHPPPYSLTFTLRHLTFVMLYLDACEDRLRSNWDVMQVNSSLLHPPKKNLTMCYFSAVINLTKSQH